MPFVLANPCLSNATNVTGEKRPHESQQNPSKKLKAPAATSLVCSIMVK